MGGDFSSIAPQYSKIASVQKAGASVLLERLQLKPGEAVLDVGCGSGQLTEHLRRLTGGTTYGVDPSEGMIREARQRYKQIAFECKTAEDIDYGPMFDVIFSNSAMQWFTDPPKALANIRRALNPGGRVGVQAPATQEYGPNFIRAMNRVALDPRTRETWRHFRSPWFFLEHADDYAQLFERAGFNVGWAALQTIITKHTPEEAYAAYVSGAAVAYLDPRFYAVPFPAGYEAAVVDVVRRSLASEAEADGLVRLAFNRVFIIATV